MAGRGVELGWAIANVPVGRRDTLTVWGARQGHGLKGEEGRSVSHQAQGERGNLSFGQSPERPHVPGGVFRGGEEHSCRSRHSVSQELMTRNAFMHLAGGSSGM